MAGSEDLDAIAALIGSTNAGLKHVDQQIVSSSANLQQSQANWTPEAVLKDYIAHQGTVPPGAQVPPPSQPAVPTPEMHPMPEMHPQIQGHVDIPANIDMTGVMDRLDVIEQQMSKLQITFDKILNGMLKNKTKQITIKFDDTELNK